MHVKAQIFILKNNLIVMPFILFLSGGRYQLEIKIPETYPFNPPKVEMDLYFSASDLHSFIFYVSSSQNFLSCPKLQRTISHSVTILFSGAIYNKDLASQH